MIEMPVLKWWHKFVPVYHNNKEIRVLLFQILGVSSIAIPLTKKQGIDLLVFAHSPKIPVGFQIWY